MLSSREHKNCQSIIHDKIYGELKRRQEHEYFIIFYTNGHPAIPEMNNASSLKQRATCARFPVKKRKKYTFIIILVRRLRSISLNQGFYRGNKFVLLNQSVILNIQFVYNGKL